MMIAETTSANAVTVWNSATPALVRRVSRRRAPATDAANAAAARTNAVRMISVPSEAIDEPTPARRRWSR